MPKTEDNKFIPATFKTRPVHVQDSSPDSALPITYKNFDLKLYSVVHANSNVKVTTLVLCTFVQVSCKCVIHATLRIQVSCVCVGGGGGANSVDPDKMAHYELPHLNLQCLLIQLFSF